MWEPSVIVRAARESLERAEGALCDEQSVYGLDSLSEVELHPFIESGLIESDLGVHREVVYPSVGEYGAKDSARMRCDLVITPEPGVALFDPIAEQKTIEQANGTLFAEVVHEISPRREGVEPGECYWVEVKSIAQFSYVDGIPAANSGYTRELTMGPVKDIAKLASEPAIWNAGMLVVLFADSERVIEHDLTQLAHECLNQGLPISMPAIESFSITDRVGNRFCGVGMLPVRL